MSKTSSFFNAINHIFRSTTKQQWFAFICLLAVLIGIGVLLPDELPLVRWFAAYNAGLALTAMMVAFVMATRHPILERLLGGLDKLYILHRWAGMLAVICIFLHWWFVPQTVHYSDNTLVGIGSDTGEWATLLLLGLVAISFTNFLPYRFWKWTHKLMGVVFIVSVFHLLFAVKPFALLSPIGLLLIAVSIVGIWAWVYYAFGFNKSKRMLGKVKAIKHLGDTTEFTISPIGNAVQWQAGQFAFIKFLKNKNIPTESHPFTISSATPSDFTQDNKNNISNEKNLIHMPRFSVAGLGDYTKKLGEHIKQNDLVELEMPYGDFIFNPKRKTQVWIGAGIGITPFLAWLHSTINTDNIDVYFYYCVRTKQEAIYHNEILSLLSSHPSIQYQLVLSEQARLTPQRILHDIEYLDKKDIAKAGVYFCGATAMRESIRTTLIEEGLAPNAFHFEHFNFKP
ncbi:ferric reductase-like transmembrane domain-containing protein [Psychrobacter sp. H8-1]|uniref:ferredoxin reductase family protein n=1 Tax=Psychrobacter sp. H8-1 TaxID=2774129 RepID=UPI0019194445|nr:ferric reductase-like transmembrane domain-containing protein [Psychrobacter sp. H8-1]